MCLFIQRRSKSDINTGLITNVISKVKSNDSNDQKSPLCGFFLSLEIIVYERKIVPIVEV